MIFIILRIPNSRTSYQTIYFVSFFLNLKSEEYHSIDVPLNQNYLKNLSKTPLPDCVSEILGFGPNFNFPNLKIPYRQLVVNLENSLSRLDVDSKTLARNDVCNILRNFERRLRKLSRYEIGLQGKLKRTITSLKSNPYLLEF